MAKNNKQKKNTPANKTSNEKSASRVEQGRAMKAKKNKSCVKFNKSKVQAANQESISRLNLNLDSLQTAVRSSKKEDVQFLNPVMEATKEFDKITEDLDDSINKMSSAF